MLGRSISNFRLNPKMSYAVSITIALTLFEGMLSLINAASIPLETAAVRTMNAVLVRGWRDIVLIPEPGPQLLIIAHYTIMGLVLTAAGLLIGTGILGHGPGKE